MEGGGSWENFGLNVLLQFVEFFRHFMQKLSPRELGGNFDCETMGHSYSLAQNWVLSSAAAGHDQDNPPVSGITI